MWALCRYARPGTKAQGLISVPSEQTKGRGLWKQNSGGCGSGHGVFDAENTGGAPATGEELRPKKMTEACILCQRLLGIDDSVEILSCSSPVSHALTRM